VVGLRIVGCELCFHVWLALAVVGMVSSGVEMVAARISHAVVLRLCLRRFVLAEIGNYLFEVSSACRDCVRLNKLKVLHDSGVGAVCHLFHAVNHQSWWSKSCTSALFHDHAPITLIQEASRKTRDIMAMIQRSHPNSIQCMPEEIVGEFLA
jgi:hypothetical protein